MPFTRNKLKGHSRSGSTSSVISNPAEGRCGAAGDATDPRTQFSHRLTQQADRWAQVTVAEKQHLLGQRLTRSLSELVLDRCALSYLVSFLSSRGAASLLQLWLEGQQLLRRTADVAPTERARRRPPDQTGPSAVSCLGRHLGESTRLAQLPEPLRSEALAGWQQLQSLAPGAGQQLPEEPAEQLLERLVDSSYALLAGTYLSEFQQSDYFHCWQVDALTAGPREICDVLFNNLALFCFMEFMEQEGLSVYLEFWMSSTNFGEQLLSLVASDKYDSVEAQNDAMVLYDKYFSLQAVSPLQFGAGARIDLELSICREGGPSPDCFIRPRLILHDVLQQYYLQPFLKSPMFFKYSMDLISSMRCPSRLAFPDRTDAMSTCSSDLGSSVTGGSLSDRWPRSTIAGAAGPDPSQLHRRRYYGLSIGHVNHVGRYESHLEPEPVQSRPSKLSRVVRSILGHDEDRVKEEMAWRIAQLIVRDVTNVTMGLGSPIHHHRGSQST